MAETAIEASPAPAFRLKVGLGWLPTVVGLAIFLVAWEQGVKALRIPAYLVPPPSTIFARLFEGLFGGTLIPHTLTTLEEIVVGYLLGCGLALALGILISQVKLAEKLVYPYVVAINSVPKVATAPLIVLWFGFGFESKVIITGLVSFFPLLVNVILGLRSADQKQVTLMRSLTASDWQTFKMVRLPNALPAIFAGLEVTIVLAVVGAIVGEFVGAKSGLGYYILFTLALSDSGGMFASFIILAVLGAVLSQSIKLIARRVVFWQRTDTPAATS